MNKVYYQKENFLNNGYRDFRRFYGGLAPIARSLTRVWVPAVDIVEESTEYIIYADVPGMKSEDIEVVLNKDVLTIKGQRNREYGEQVANYKQVERVDGAFSRQFILSEISDTGSIVANLEQGVLKVRVPKLEKIHPRRIPVN